MIQWFNSFQHQSLPTHREPLIQGGLAPSCSHFLLYHKPTTPTRIKTLSASEMLQMEPRLSFSLLVRSRFDRKYSECKDNFLLSRHWETAGSSDPCDGTQRDECSTRVPHDDSTVVLFPLWCDRVQGAHLSLSHPGWRSSAGPSPARSRSYTAAGPPSGQTRRPSSAAGRTRSSRSSSGGRRTPGRASQTLSGRSSPCSRCTLLQRAWGKR